MSRYRWQTLPPITDPGLMADLELGFDDLPEAELWLGAMFTELRAAGATSVTLVEDGAAILGPMALDPAD